MKTFIGSLNVSVMISLLLISHVSDAQHWEWAKGAHAVPYYTEEVTTDATGNIYMIHQDYGGGIAVSKMNAQGTVLWDKYFGCCGPTSGDMRITVDNAGNVYIIGAYYGSITFGGITLETGSISQDNTYTFLVKLNTLGNVVWAINAAGPVGGSQRRDIVADGQGNIILTGSVKGTAYFGNVVSTSNSAKHTSFVAKYNTNGNVLWAQRASGTESFGLSLDADGQGNVYAIGFYDGYVQWGSITLPLILGNTSYLTKISSSGNVVWGKKIAHEVTAIATDGAGSSYVSGYFEGTTSMGNGTTLTSAGKNDVMVARFDPGGNVLWARSAGGSEDDGGSDLDIDQDGNCYVIGTYRSVATFGTEVLGFPPQLFNAGFTARYLPDGTIDWVEPVIPNHMTNAQRISTTPIGKCYILFDNLNSGNSLKFGSDLTLTNANSPDVIAKLDGQAFKIPVIVFDEAFICFPCFPFDPVLDYEYRFWSERTGVRSATYRKVSDRNNRDEILWKDDRLEITLHDELPEGIYYFQLRAILRDRTVTDWTEALAFEVEGSRKASMIYPNPVKDKLTIDYQATEKETLVFTLYDRNGRVLLWENKEVGEGKNTLELLIPPVKRDANPLNLQLQSRLQGTVAWQLIRE